MFIHLVDRSCFASHSDKESASVSTNGKLAFFYSEYNFVVHYKPGKTNILADAPQI